MSRGKKPQPKIALPEGWWDRLVNFCQAGGLATTGEEIYSKTRISRRTFLTARETNSFTEPTFDNLVKNLGCKSRNELLGFLGQGLIEDRGETIISTPQPLGQSLTELFRNLPINSIKSHIVLALLPSRGKDAVEKSLTEILSPECIHVIAKKLVDDTMDNFCDFYFVDLDSPPNIKRNVAVAIAANRDLRQAHATKVAHSGYRDMTGWFQVFSFFCSREIMVAVENALIVVSGEDGFVDKFDIFSDDLYSLIENFSRLGCVSAARIFQETVEELEWKAENGN